MDSRFEDCLKERSLRITSARQRVYKVLSDSQKSLSAKDVFEEIKRTSSIKTDQVSVYRNLTLFAEIGLAHRLQNGKYSACSHEHDDHKHIHVIVNCSRCGSTIEVQSHDKNLCGAVNKMKDLVEDFSQFTGLTLQGICKDCQEA